MTKRKCAGKCVTKNIYMHAIESLELEYLPITTHSVLCTTQHCSFSLPATVTKQVCVEVAFWAHIWEVYNLNLSSATLIVSKVFLNTSESMLGQYLQTDHDHLLPYPS
jgi:hypothetical protein